MAPHDLSGMEFLDKILRIVLHHANLFQHHLFFLFDLFRTKFGMVQEIRQQIERFRQVLVEYNRAPGVMRDRLYIDALQQILTSTTKILVDARAGSNLLYLPLDKLMQMTGQSAAPPAEVMAKPAESPSTESLPSTSSRSRDALRSRDREPR